MRWLSGPSPSAVTEALRAVVPELSGLPVDIPDPAGRDDPVWQSSSAVLGEDFFVKFAWSETAARRVLRQIRVLDALAREPAVPYLPQVVASGTDPLIMVTRRVRGASLFAVADFIDLDHAGRQNVSLWELAPAFFVIGVGIGLSFATIPVVALGDAKPDEAGSASGSFSSIQQLASAIGSAVGHVDLLPSRNLGTGPRDGSHSYRRSGRHRLHPPGRRPDAPQGTGRTPPVSKQVSKQLSALCPASPLP
jgi:hypothetical protein